MNKVSVKQTARVRSVVSTSINQPFAHLWWTDLLSPADIKFWAGSPLGSAILASWFRGQGYEPGRVTKPRQRASHVQCEPNFGTVQAARYSVAGDVVTSHAPKLRAAKTSEDRSLSSTTGRGEIRREAIVSGGSFDVPLYETRADAKRGMQPSNALRQFVDVIAMQAAGRAVRVVEDRSGKEFSDTMRDEALAEAVTAIVRALHRLATTWERATRFIQPAFPDRTLLSERRRRSYFWCVAYRAAFRNLTANPAGMTGRKGALQVVELDHADAIPAAYEQAIEDRGRQDYRLARRLVWSKLGCIWGMPHRIGKTFNFAESARAVRRRWRLLMLLLRGMSSAEAVRRCGFGESFLRNGQLARLLASVGVQSTSGFVM